MRGTVKIVVGGPALRFYDMMGRIGVLHHPGLNKEVVFGNLHRLFGAVHKFIDAHEEMYPRTAFMEGAKFIVPTLEPSARKVPWTFASGAPDSFKLLSQKMAGSVCLKAKGQAKGKAKAKAKAKAKTTPKKDRAQSGDAETAETTPKKARKSQPPIASPCTDAIIAVAEGGCASRGRLFLDVLFEAVECVFKGLSPSQIKPGGRELGVSLGLEFLWTGQIFLNGQTFKAWSKLIPHLQQALRSYTVPTGEAVADVTGDIMATLAAVPDIPGTADDAQVFVEGFCADTTKVNALRDFFSANNIGCDSALPAQMQPSFSKFSAHAWAEVQKEARDKEVTVRAFVEVLQRSICEVVPLDWTGFAAKVIEMAVAAGALPSAVEPITPSKDHLEAVLKSRASYMLSFLGVANSLVKVQHSKISAMIKGHAIIEEKIVAYDSKCDSWEAWVEMWTSLLSDIKPGMKAADLTSIVDRVCAPPQAPTPTASAVAAVAGSSDATGNTVDDFKVDGPSLAELDKNFMEIAAGPDVDSKGSMPPHALRSIMKQVEHAMFMEAFKLGPGGESGWSTIHACDAYQNKPELVARNLQPFIHLNFVGRITTEPSANCLKVAEVEGVQLYCDGSLFMAFDREFWYPAWLVPVTEQDGEANLKVNSKTLPVQCSFQKVVLGPTIQKQVNVTLYSLTPEPSKVHIENAFLKRPMVEGEAEMAEKLKAAKKRRKDMLKTLGPEKKSRVGEDDADIRKVRHIMM